VMTARFYDLFHRTSSPRAPIESSSFPMFRYRKLLKIVGHSIRYYSPKFPMWV